MTYEVNGFNDTIATLPEDIDWTKTEIYAKVPEEAPRNFWDKLWNGPSNWEMFPQFYIKGEPGTWVRIYDPNYDPNDHRPTKIIEHTQDGNIVKREICVDWFDSKYIKHRKITVDWKWCLYRVLEGENAPIITKTYSVSKYI